MTPQKYHRLKEIFAAAADCDTNERAALISAACDGDEVLLREAQSLLGYHDRAERFIEKPAFLAGVHLLSEGQNEALRGHAVGSYKLIREVGRGGMGAVYLAARADEEFEKRAAIKLIKRGMDTEDVLRRFRNERQILARLEHKNIARLLDGGATSDGSPYLVMEYVEGAPIDKYCDQHRLSTAERLRLFRIVCSAVAYAHQNLIIHRDIKPGNILVTEDGTPKLLDFGIAKILTEELSGQTIQTATAVRLMTPDYASPEQVRGDTITTSTDIYSLGVLLYKLLTGHQPYRFKTPLPAEIERVICDQEPSRPSTAINRIEEVTTSDGATLTITPDVVSSARNSHPEKLRRLLDGDLDNIVMMAMRKDTARRYSSVEQLSEDIRRHLDALPVIARKDTFAYRSGKFIKRNKVGVAAATFIAFILVIGIIATTWQARIAHQQRDLARAEAQRAEQLNRFSQEMLTSADPSEQGKDATVAQRLAEAARRIETEFPNQPETTAAMRSAIGMTYLGLGMFDDAEPQLRLALDTRMRLFGRENPDVASSMNNLAMLLGERGNIQEAESLYRDALDISRRVRGPDHLETASVMHNLAALLLLKGSLDDAERMNREELAIRRRALGNDNPDVAKSLNDLGVVLGTKGDLEGAEQLHREALAITRRVYGDEHVNVAATLATLAAIIEERGNYTEAETLYREALAMRRKLLGPDHPTVTWTLYNYAYMLERKGDYQRAADLAREVLALRGKTLSDEHPMISSSLQVLGKSLMAQGNARAAEPILRESLDLRRKALPADHWLIANSESVLGDCLTKLRRFREADALLTESYAKLKAKFGEEHSRTRDAAERIERLHKALGKT